MALLNCGEIFIQLFATDDAIIIEKKNLKKNLKIITPGLPLLYLDQLPVKRVIFPRTYKSNAL